MRDMNPLTMFFAIFVLVLLFSSFSYPPPSTYHPNRARKAHKGLPERHYETQLDDIPPGPSDIETIATNTVTMEYEKNVYITPDSKFIIHAYTFDQALGGTGGSELKGTRRSVKMKTFEMHYFNNGRAFARVIRILRAQKPIIEPQTVTEGGNWFLYRMLSDYHRNFPKNKTNMNYRITASSDQVYIRRGGGPMVLFRYVQRQKLASAKKYILYDVEERHKKFQEMYHL